MRLTTALVVAGVCLVSISACVRTGENSNVVGGTGEPDFRYPFTCRVSLGGVYDPGENGGVFSQ